MSLIKIEVQRTRAVIRSQEPLTVGLRGAKVQFSFGQDWDNLNKTAVFRQGDEVRTVLNVAQEATIPWEVLKKPGVPVEIGVFGFGTNKAIPTIWTTTQPVRPGADPEGDPSAEPTPGLWEQMQGQLDSLEEAITKAESATYVVTVRKGEDGADWIAQSTDDLANAYRAGRTMVCHWLEHNLLLPLSDPNGGREFTFRTVADGEEYSVKLIGDDVRCTRKSLVEECSVRSVNGQIGDVVLTTSVTATITEQSDGTYTTDLTHEELLAAYDSGIPLYCKYGGKILPVIVANKSQVVFEAVHTDTLYKVAVGVSRVTVTATPLATEAVRYTPQDLTTEQQAQVRQNLGLDGLPTAGGSKYRLIAKIEFDGSKYYDDFTLTQDMDGNPLELTNLFFYADWQAREAGRLDAWLHLNGVKCSGIFSMETTAYKTIAKVEAFDGFFYLYCDYKIAGTSNALSKIAYVRDISGSKINRIRWWSNDGPPAGSTLMIYGY